MSPPLQTTKQRNWKARFFLLLTILFIAALLFLGYFFIGSYADEIQKRTLNDVAIYQTSENNILLWNVQNGTGQRFEVNICTNEYLNHVAEICRR